MDQTIRTPALVLIDVQNGFRNHAWGQRNNPLAEEKMADLLRHWRLQRWPVIHIQHLSTDSNSPLRPGQPGVEFQSCVKPISGEIIVQKHVNSAFIKTELEAILRNDGIQEMIIVGLATDHCVSTTTRMAANLGFSVTVVSDATATFARQGADGKVYSAETVHALALASLNQEFAKIECSVSVIGSLAQRFQMTAGLFR